MSRSAPTAAQDTSPKQPSPSRLLKAHLSPFCIFHNYFFVRMIFFRIFAVVKIDEAISKYIAYIATERRLATLTVVSYSHTLNEFQIYLMKFEISEVEDITSLYVRDWQISLMEAGLKAATVTRCLVTLRSWFKYLRRQGFVSKDVMASVSSPKQPKHLPIFFREKETEALYTEALFPDTFEGHRDRLMLQLLYETGIRRSELISLKNSSVDFSALTIKVLGKRDKERYIPIENEMACNIKRFFALKEEISDCSDSLFVKKDGKPITTALVASAVKRYMTLVSNAERISPHIFRHSFATHMLNEGADINAIKELLGHTDLAATEVYTHVTREHLKETYKHAHPRANKK